MAIHTIEVASKPIVSSETVSDLEHMLRGIGIEAARVTSSQLFTLASPDGIDLDTAQLAKAASLVHHGFTQEALLDTPLDAKGWDFAIRVDAKPGVTDNAARVFLDDLRRTNLIGYDVFSSPVHYVRGAFNPALSEQLSRVASNPQIHDITILTREDFARQGGFERTIHPVALPERPNAFPVDLGAMSREELLLTGKQGTLLRDPVLNPKGERGGTLSLDEDYLDAILAYTKSDSHTKHGRASGVLTDTELELFAQMWSEHCRHSIYNASVPGLGGSVFKNFIKNPTLKVLEAKPYLGVSIFKDNSGIFKFNDKWLVCIKNETHNSPSALDPFGGAITGIVGVNRDPAGSGLGAEVIGNFLFYFLGHPEDHRRYFKTREQIKTTFDTTTHLVKDLLLNPLQIYRGVTPGVEQGGNQMGIAIELGMCDYHTRYNGKPIVGVGSWGRMPITINGKASHEKHIDVGDHLYIVGGRAGRDGIHGATFSSEELSANSPATAVQIGDPYTQRKMFEALLELRDLGYIKFITDLGAGGVCCAAMEMAEETNGLDITLDKLLVKYPNMTATELLMNESQERMAIAIDHTHSKDIEAILRKHEVEFSDIGTFTNSGRAIVASRGENVVNLDMNFIHHGMPQRTLQPKEYRLSEESTAVLKDCLDLIIEKRAEAPRDEFYAMLRRPNLGSIAPFMDRMDSTVKGLGVQHCIQGKGRVTGHAACSLVDIQSSDGLVMAFGHAERQAYIDSKRMGANSFLRSIGHNIAMGGRLDYMPATDQALWQNGDKGEYQQMLIEANEGMASIITGCQVPVISGKDSIFNQAKIYDAEGNEIKRGVFPTLLMTTTAKIDDVSTLTTMDAKREGHLVYVVGSKTKEDFGGSEYMNMHSEREGIEFNVGNVSNESIPDVYDTFRRMNQAQQAGLVQSANYVGNGGLTTALKETSLAGCLGIEIDLDRVHADSATTLRGLQWGETEGRFVVTIKPEDQAKFETAFSGKHSLIGKVTGDSIVMRHQGSEFLHEHVDDLLKIYHKMDQKEAA